MLAPATVTVADHALSWNAIDWRQVNRAVSALRQRIYRAAAAGDVKNVRNLQRLMLRSRANRLLAVRYVTQRNAGKGTPGVDKVVVKTPQARIALYRELRDAPLGKASPVKRTYIPKTNGKRRPLGIPTVRDRCYQMIVKNALEPFWEAHFEGSSYGFRPGRSCHDAIVKIHRLANAQGRRRWVLETDIKGAFDALNHTALLGQIGAFPARHWITAWLKAGVMENDHVEPTPVGAPQGGIISPLLLNIALHGMEAALGIRHDYRGKLTGSSDYALVRYADDLVIFGHDRDQCERAQETLSHWLAKRGLALSPEKTQIVHLSEGFDFLGFNIRLYATPGRTRLGTTTLTKPSSSAVKAFRQRLKDEWKMMLSWPTVAVISRLNPILRGWGNYYRVGASKRIFNQLDDFVWKRQARFAHRRHPGKAWYWRRQRYWTTLAWRDDQWVFYDKETGRHLGKLSWLPIKRHVLVRERASPDNPAQRAYWAARRSRARNGSQQTCRLWTRQQGLCAVCQAPLENGEELNVHHVIPKHQGGTEALDNLQLVHLYCHQQHHAHEHNRRRSQTA